jgi:hypothetical protein
MTRSSLVSGSTSIQSNRYSLGGPFSSPHVDLTSSDKSSSISTFSSRRKSSTPGFSQPAAKKNNTTETFRTTIVFLTGRNAPQTTLNLDVAIADYLTANSLPLSGGKDSLLQRVLFHARFVNANYKPPNRNRVTFPLINATFGLYKKHEMKSKHFLLGLKCLALQCIVTEPQLKLCRKSMCWWLECIIPVLCVGCD